MTEKKLSGDGAPGPEPLEDRSLDQATGGASNRYQVTKGKPPPLGEVDPEGGGENA